MPTDTESDDARCTDRQPLAPGDQLTIDWIVLSHANAAAAYGYPITVDVFVAPEDDAWHPDADGKVALLVEQDWLDATDSWQAEYARYYVDGVIVEAGDPLGHARIDSLEGQL